MIYALMLYTVVAMATPSGSSRPNSEMDWRPIAEFKDFVTTSKASTTYAKDKCEQAAKEMNLKPEKYRCIRTY